jgi:uncharacterized protein YhbP (UPF0306 family)
MRPVRRFHSQDHGRNAPCRFPQALTKYAIRYVSDARARRNAMSEDLATRITALMDAHHVMALATLDLNGPHVVNLFYARAGVCLVWVSDPASCHSRHLEQRAEVAATIARDYCDFTAIQGLQIRGRAKRIVDPREQAQARNILEGRHPFLQRLPDPVRIAYQGAQLYRLEPKRIALIDNQRGFASKEVLECEPLALAEVTSK